MTFLMPIAFDDQGEHQIHKTGYDDAAAGIRQFFRFGQAGVNARIQQLYCGKAA